MALFAATDSGYDWLKLTTLIVLFILSLFMWILILIQRGRGGGLIGALGGAGGSSPFGSRAGDKFTRATLIIALVWIVLNAGLTWALQKDQTPKAPPEQVGGGPAQPVPAENPSN
jgi:protein translocase SecG subunit